VKMIEKLRLRCVTSAAAGNDVNYVTANQSVPNPLLRQLLGLRRPYPCQEQVNFTFKQGCECLSDMCTVRYVHCQICALSDMCTVRYVHCQICALYSHSNRFTFAIVQEASISPCDRPTTEPNDRAGLASDTVPPLPDHRPATYWVQHTISCTAHSKAPEDGQNCCPKHVKLNFIYQ
jgi:hypothetical protein